MLCRQQTPHLGLALCSWCDHGWLQQDTLKHDLVVSHVLECLSPDCLLNLKTSEERRPGSGRTAVGSCSHSVTGLIRRPAIGEWIHICWLKGCLYVQTLLISLLEVVHVGITNALYTTCECSTRTECLFQVSCCSRMHYSRGNLQPHSG